MKRLMNILVVILSFLVVSGLFAQTPEQIMRTVRELNMKGNFGQSRRLCEQLLREYPESGLAASALFWQAYAFEAEGEPQRAVPLYGQLVKKYPEDEYADDALRKRAGILKMLKKNRLTAKALQSLTDNYPDSPFTAEALIELGDLYGYQLDEFDSALKAYGKYPVDAPNIAEAQFKIGFFKENRDFDDAPLKVYLKANRELELKRLNRVETALKQAIIDYPKSAVLDDILVLLGRNEVALGMKLRLLNPLMSREQKKRFSKHYQDAARYFGQVIRDFPQSDTAAQAKYYLAQSYGREDLGGVNDFLAAKREYQELIKLYPDSYWAEKGKARLQALEKIF